MEEPDPTDAFEMERGRLTGMASRLLGDTHEAEDIVQKAWLRLSETSASIDSLPAWLTTVTTRLCLDRLRARIPVPAETVDAAHDEGSQPALMERTEWVGQAMQVVVDTLTPNERVAFVLADAFGYDFATIGDILGRSAAGSRKLASRAREKVRASDPGGPVADWQVVDAFMSAARGGDLQALIALLAPDAMVEADAAAILAGTPEHIEGRETVASFFNGSALAALSAYIEGRPGAAWFNRGQPRVAFDFTVVEGTVQKITFRADEAVLATVVKREGDSARTR